MRACQRKPKIKRRSGMPLHQRQLHEEQSMNQHGKISRKEEKRHSAPSAPHERLQALKIAS